MCLGVSVIAGGGLCNALCWAAQGRATVSAVRTRTRGAQDVLGVRHAQAFEQHAVRSAVRGRLCRWQLCERLSRGGFPRLLCTSLC